MNFKSNFPALLTTVTILTFSPISSLALPDLDSDGQSDIIVVQITDDTLVWNAHLSSTSYGSPSGLGSLGEKGNHLIPGTWITAGSNLIGVASYKKKDDQVTWTVLNGSDTDSFILGKGSDILVSGGDYDGNGLTDAAIIRSSGKGVIRLNPLGGAAQSVGVEFPKSAAGDAVGTFINRTGSNDELGLVETKSAQYILHLRGAAGEEQRITLGQASSKFTLKEAHGIASPSGTDAVLLEERDGNDFRVQVIDLTGQRLFLQSFEGRPELVVGDYAAADGDEFILYSDGSADIINPFSSETGSLSGLVDGVIADLLNVNRFGAAGAGGALAKVCPVIRGPGGGEIYKTIGSDHFSDARRGAANFIVAAGTRGIASSCITIYDSKGTQIYALGRWPTPGAGWSSRHYGTIGCSGGALSGASLAGIARRNSGSEAVFLKIDSRTCIEIPDAGRCIHSKSC